MYAVEACGLTKAYGRHRAVDGLDMHVHEGDIYGFVGKNGAGKSTVMKMIDCLVAPTGGELSVFGENVQAEGTAVGIGSRIGALIESPGLIEGASAFDNLMAKAVAIGLTEPKQKCEDMIRLVGLEAAGRKHAKRYSQGMKQRLGIGLALLGRPDLLLLDEPFNGLDPEATRDLRRRIVLLNQTRGVTVVVSTHVLDQLGRMATRYGVIAQGRMVCEMTADEVMRASGDSVLVRTTAPERTLAQLEGRFPDCTFAMEPGDVIRVRGGSVQELAETLHELDATVLELSESHQDMEEFFVGLMEGGERHVQSA